MFEMLITFRSEIIVGSHDNTETVQCNIKGVTGGTKQKYRRITK